MKLPSGPVAERIGFLLCRIVVPLWVLAGALMKLQAKSPKLLPKNIWTNADDAGLNLYCVLFVLVGLEFFAIGVMWFLPRFSRFMAIWMLSIFCLVLLGEIAAGNTKCGCLGAASPSPWVMLAIDASLLLGVLLFRPKRSEGEPWVPRRGLALAALVTALGFGVTGVRVLSEIGSTGGGGEVELPPDGGIGSTGGAPPSPGTPAALPGYFRIKDDAALVGRRLLETELGRLVKGWPDDIGMGPRYVIFFSRSCDHCRELLETHFQAEPPVPTTLVAIPESKQGFKPGTWLDMQYCTDCLPPQLELQTGVDYLITPPVVLAIAEGEIACAKEADEALEPECFIWH